MKIEKKNREIKFRIWFNEPGAPPQMIYPHIDDFIYNSDGNIIGRAFLDCDYQKGLKVYYQVVMNPDRVNKDTLGLLDNTIHEARDSVLMECVGAKDKNHTCIYEGDIIKWNGPHDSEWVGVVKYLECKFIVEWFKTPYPIAKDRAYSGISDQHIIVGNMIENKDLMK